MAEQLNGAGIGQARSRLVRRLRDASQASSGTPRVTVRANYVGLPSMAGRGAAKGGESRLGQIERKRPLRGHRSIRARKYGPEVKNRRSGAPWGVCVSALPSQSMPATHATQAYKWRRLRPLVCAQCGKLVLRLTALRSLGLFSGEEERRRRARVAKDGRMVLAFTFFTSPVYGGGRRAKLAGRGNSSKHGANFAPSPTLPRKREREQKETSLFENRIREADAPSPCP